MREVVNVLLIDDDEEDYIITKNILGDVQGRRKYKLDWVSSYEKAMKEVAERKHHVYLIDYRLGAHNGLDIIRKVYTEDSTATMILFTGHGDMEIDEQAMNAGAVDFLVKGSLTPHELDRAIRYGIRHTSNLRRIRELNADLEKRVNERTAELEKTVKELAASNKKLKIMIREKEKARAELRDSQALYVAIAKNFPNGMIGVVDTEYHFVFADGAELNHQDGTRSDVRGITIPGFLGKELFQTIEHHFTGAFAGKRQQFELEFDGKHYLVNLTPLPSASGVISQLLIVTSNISIQKRAEMEIYKSLSKEKQLNELKSRFVTMASHEFRTPLSTMLTSVDLISRYNSPGDKEKIDRHVNRIRSSISNLVEILNDFLSLEKLEGGKIQYLPVNFELHEMIKSVIDEIQFIAKKNQRFFLDYSSGGSGDTVLLDKTMMRNILINLLSNAVKYSSEGKHVFITVRKESARIIMSVRDEGMGIPDADKERLFERFFRAENVLNIQGTGLGLSIVKRYVDLMGGTISFKSQLGEGSEFTIIFPDLTEKN